MKFANRFVCCVAAVVLLVIPAQLFAWGVEGHQITCLIAEDHLSPAARAGIHDLLGKDVNISDAEIAAWADELRRDDKSTASWHFANIPTSAQAFDPAREGRGGNNVIDKVNEFARVVADRSRSKKDRADALKFLVHFVGDLHQPLHVAERNRDGGGNARLVFYGKGKAVSLHGVWDTQIIYYLRGDQPIARLADGWNAQITRKQLAEWQKGTPVDWANEAHVLAINVAYAGIPEDGPPPKLSADYLKAADACVQEQLEKGGVRLAMMLNKAFGG